MIRLPHETPPDVPSPILRLTEDIRARAAAALLRTPEEILRGKKRHDTAGNFNAPALTEARTHIAGRAERALLRKPERADIREELQQRTAATPEKKRTALLDGAYGILGTEDIEKHLRLGVRKAIRTIDGEQHWHAEDTDPATGRRKKGPRIDFGNKIWRTGTADEIQGKLKECAGATLHALGITVPKSAKLTLKDGTPLTDDTLLTWEWEDEQKAKGAGNAEEILEILLMTSAEIQKPAARLWAKERTVSFTCRYTDPTTTDVSTFRVTMDMRKLLEETAASGDRLARFDAATFSHDYHRSCLNDIATIEEEIGGVSALLRFSELEEGPVGARRRSRGKREVIARALFERLGEAPDSALAIREVTLAEALRERSATQRIAELAASADRTGNRPRARLALIASDMLARNPHLARSMAGKAVRRAMALEDLACENLRKLEEDFAVPLRLRTAIDALEKFSPPKLPDETPTQIWNGISTRTRGKLRINATPEEEAKLTQWDTVLPIIQTVLETRGKDTKFAKAFERLSGIAPTDTFTKATLSTWLKGRDTKGIAHIVALAYQNAHGEPPKKSEEYEEQKKAAKEKIAKAEKRTQTAHREDHQKLQEQPDRACWRVIGAYMKEKHPKQTPKERRTMLFELKQSIGLPEVGCSPQVFAENAPNEYLRDIGIHRAINLRSTRDRDEVWRNAVQHFNRALGLWHENDDALARSIVDFVARNSIIWMGCHIRDLWRKAALNTMSVPRLLAVHTRIHHLFQHGITINEGGKTKTFPFPRDPAFLLYLQNLEEAILQKVLLLSRHGNSTHIREGELAPLRLLVGQTPWTMAPHDALQRAHTALRKGFGGKEHFLAGMDRDGEETPLKKWLWNAEDPARRTQINPFQELLEQEEVREPVQNARRQDRWGRRLIPTRWKLWRPWSWNHTRFWEKRFWTGR